MEEKLGELVNTCQSFDQRITSFEEVSSEQSRLVKASENSSKEVLELVENEIKADIRNSKDELRKQRKYRTRKSLVLSNFQPSYSLSPPGQAVPLCPRTPAWPGPGTSWTLCSSI